jgi:exopolyphosphatase / guanosine-5'-triphosphate,3'-diphosphate pyrophosphatase
MSKRFAIISIGTNSTRLLLADVAPAIARVETARSVGTRIGEGLGEQGRLGDEPIQRTLEAIGQFQRAVKGHYIRLFAVATSALRRAENAEDFSQRIEALLGTPLRILSGEEEATASYRGALTAFGELRGERVGVLDVGGGSTEYAIGTSTEPEKVISCETGAVRLTEAVPELAGRDGAVKEESVERARAIARKALEPLAECAAVERLALVGGSATTTAGMLRGRRTAIDSYDLTRADLRRALERLLPMPLEERKKVAGMKPQRADILPGGIIAIETAMEIIGSDKAVATTSDLLLGILLQERDASVGQAQVVYTKASETRGRFRT